MEGKGTAWLFNCFRCASPSADCLVDETAFQSRSPSKQLLMEIALAVQVALEQLPLLKLSKTFATSVISLFS